MANGGRLAEKMQSKYFDFNFSLILKFYYDGNLIQEEIRKRKSEGKQIKNRENKYTFLYMKIFGVSFARL